MSHYQMADLEWVDLGGTGWRRASVTLDKGDTASNPASTKPERVIHGPAVVTYEAAPRNSSITAHVEDVPK